MSKLCDMLEARQTGRVKLYPETGLVRTEEVQQLVDLASKPLIEYRIGVVAQVRVVCKNDQELAYAKNNTKRQLIHEIFGEFRKPLIEIERAVLMRDFEVAVAGLRNLQNEMFSS
jgi:hypothetical protein